MPQPNDSERVADVDQDSPDNNPCGEPGCLKFATWSGLCPAHYKKRFGGADLKPPCIFCNDGRALDYDYPACASCGRAK